MDRFARRMEATFCEKMGMAELKNREGLLGIVLEELVSQNEMSGID